MMWDHGLLQFPKFILDPLPNSPNEATGDAIRRTRQTLDHPLYAHYSPDRGHVAAMSELGMIDGNKVRFFLQPAYPNFHRHAYHTPVNSAFGAKLAFAGNVYLEASSSIAFRGDRELAAIEARVLEAKTRDLTACLWDLIQSEIAALEEPDRQRLGLDPNSTFFWRFVYDLIELVGNTAARLAVLTGIKRPYEFYGNFIEPQTTSTLRSKYGLTFRRSLDYFTELPLLFMNSDLVVDVVNSGFNSGISCKVMGCLACGGLLLFDYKDDFRESMGDVADQIMYRSVDHLNTLIEEYLGAPRRRRDVTRYLQHRVCTEFNFSALCSQILTKDLAL
jgi:hypothetical protein